MTDEILPLLLRHERFVITTHIRPDGDAIGSQVALGRFLQALGKEVALLNSDPPPGNLAWLPGIEQVETFEGAPEHLKQIAGADVVIIADTNALERIGKLADPVTNSGALKVLIDHHTGPENWFDATYARDTASSTGELVYELIAAHDADAIDDPIATALYAAILTDTGSFRYSSVTPSVHRIAADLMERGDLLPEVIHSHLYDTKSLQGLRLLSRSLDTLQLRYDGRVGYMVVSRRMMKETDASSDDTEGFVSYVHSIDGVRVALLFTETASGTKISFRSKGDMHVNEWAQAFGGGGHRNASGAYVREPLDEVIDQVLAAAPEFLDLDDGEPTDDEMSQDDEDYLALLQAMRAQESRSP
ncbi:MAG: bifunctional oligoribonuclease/PAP phosphatase NrnA [Bacteroidetes bacterium]|jgi:phosphoesterase RecJ-like protein|nr:bifunctional oligoribonuclease/PAP phosphatase NrnA [Bacteroidota bacterium]